jgi:hypothetical protein
MHGKTQKERNPSNFPCDVMCKYFFLVSTDQSQSYQASHADCAETNCLLVLSCVLANRRNWSSTYLIPLLLYHFYDAKCAKSSMSEVYQMLFE